MIKKDPKAFVTNEILDSSLNDVTDTILEGMDNLVGGLKTDVRSGFNQVNSRLDRLEADVSYIKDDIRGLTGELGETASKKDFNELKHKVDKYSAS
jgi:hypothetical protein